MKLPKQYGNWELAYYSEQLQLFDNALNGTMVYPDDDHVGPPTMVIESYIGGCKYHPIHIPIAAMKAWIREWERWNEVLDT